jgi:ABC-type transporter Mla MlaB component
LPTPDDQHDQVVDLDVSWLVPADLCAVDALARLQVAASRRGCWLQLHGADGGLVELIDLIGLGGVVRLCPCCSSSMPGGQGRVGGS